MPQMVSRLFFVSFILMTTATCAHKPPWLAGPKFPGSTDVEIIGIALQASFLSASEELPDYIVVSDEANKPGLSVCCNPNAKRLLGEEIPRNVRTQMTKLMDSMIKKCCVARKADIALHYLSSSPWIRVVKTNELPPMPDGGHWRGFHERFPKGFGLLKISKPVYSADGKLCFVSIAWIGGAERGEERFYFLHKEANKWVVRLSARLSVS